MITINVNRISFDDTRVLRAVGAARKQALQAAARQIQRTARRSMQQARKDARIPERELDPEVRERRKIANRIRAAQGRPRLKPRMQASKPGQAPNASARSPLRRLLRYAFDLQTQSSVIGPVGFPGSDVPRVLEEGGRTTRGDDRIRIAPRPYMAPALRSNLARVPTHWRNAIGGR